jgi:hypothetical protein
MPLKSGSSKGVISDNIREFSHGATYQKTAKKFGASKAHKQAIAVAFSNARKSRKGK